MESFAGRFWAGKMPRSKPRLPLPAQPMEVFVDDETKLTLHGLQQYYVKLKDSEKNRKLFDLLDVLEFNQVTPRGCPGVPGLGEAGARGLWP